MSGIMQTNQIPTELDYSDIIRKEEELELKVAPDGEHASATPSTVVASELGTMHDGGIATPAATLATKNVADSPAMDSENGDTQTSNVPRMKNALQGFMLPERLTQVRLL